MSAKLENILEQVSEALVPRVSWGRMESLGSTLTAIRVGARSEGACEELPDRFYLWKIQVFLTNIMGGATEVQLGLSLDEQGAEPVSEYASKRIVFGDGTTSGGAVFAYTAPGSPMWTDRPNDSASEGRLFARVRLNAGTADADVYVTWTSAIPR